LFFSSGSAQLYGFYEAPRAATRSTAVLFVHGSFEERQDAHLVMRDAAERLASDGFPTLRFDLFGHGDSEGDFEDATFETWVANTRDAARELVRLSGCEHIALVGLRAGALVAAAAAQSSLPLSATETRPERAAFSRLVLWQPVTDGKTYVMDVLRAFLAAEMMVHRHATTTRDALVARLREGQLVNVYGYHLSPALFESLARADLASLLERVEAPVLCVDVTRGPNAPVGAEIARLATRFAPRVQAVPAHEPQPLYAEGKLFLTHADNVFDATARFLGESP
jgi:exosortase A-associated hydrolase 2